MNDYRDPTDESTEREAGQYLTFVVGEETFGMDISVIHEIIDYGELTRVPLVPDFIRGVINLRGSVVPVIDLNARLGRGPATRSKRTAVVIVALLQEDDQELNLGVLVDLVNKVVDIENADIEPPPQFGTAIRTDFIEGMARREEGFMILLDPGRVFAVEELSLLGEEPPVHGAPRETMGAAR